MDRVLGRECWRREKRRMNCSWRGESVFFQDLMEGVHFGIVIIAIYKTSN